MKKKVSYAILAVFIICIATFIIILQPYFKAAVGLGKVVKADSAEFQATIHLNPDTLSENERGLIDTLEWIFQAKEEDLLNLKFMGQRFEKEMTVRVYCNAVEYPLTEIYYGESQKTVNIKMFYEAIEESLPDKLWLLKVLMPEWNMEEETITFEQLEALGINLEALIPLEKGQDSESFSTIQCVYLLSRLEKEKDENGDIWFRGNYENYSVQFCVKENEEGTVIFLEGEAIEEEQKVRTFEADISVDYIYPATLGGTDSEEN